MPQSADLISSDRDDRVVPFRTHALQQRHRYLITSSARQGRRARK
jgi:hypothetical protein